MNWQLAAFTLLAFALAGGFAWYERTRPDARIVALVATLAAFAALGRIAFAALPNVKPTSDIVLISGYALGGPPGFAVGAIAGLTSNLFFGQGPWTPWQMAAWGVTGLLGAGLARVTRNQIGRIPLAIACGVAGFGFTATQDFGDWVTYSDHSQAQLGVYIGKGVGFDVVHALGCVGFALAFGPALARSVQRFARRLTVTWLPAGGAALVVVALVLGWTGTAGVARGASTPAAYLLSAQNGDGGFGSAPGGQSSQLYSGWAALGLEAAGYNLANVRHGGASTLDYIRSAPAPDVGSLERTILVLGAAGAPTGGLAGSLQRQVRTDGSIQDQVNLTSFAILALRAAGVTPPASALRWLIHQQDTDGGFNFATAGGASDVDDTGAALEALAGVSPTASARAVRYLDSQENSDGGFPSQPGGLSNAQSTAWAIQGLLAAGAPAQRALSYLRSLTAPDGHVRYASGNDQTPVWVTGEALMALTGKPLPLAVAPAAIAPATPSPARKVQHLSRRRSVPTRKPIIHHRRAGHAGPPRLGQLADYLALADALALAPIG